MKAKAKLFSYRLQWRAGVRPSARLPFLGFAFFLALRLVCSAAGAAEVFSTPSLSLRQEIHHAIAQGAAWLEKNQDARGWWSTADHPAVTALALVALRGATANDAPETAVTHKGYEY